MLPGRVVLLNGPSSSGKSSIGSALLTMLADPWFLVPVDAISGLRSAVLLDEAGVSEMLRRTRLGYHRVLAGLAAAGNDVIADYPLSEPWRLADLLVVLDGFDLTLVDVHCSAAELDRREAARGDRPAGLARSQRCFDHDDRDIEVDTTTLSAEQCAAMIIDALPRLAAPKAADRLR